MPTADEYREQAKALLELARTTLDGLERLGHMLQGIELQDRARDLDAREQDKSAPTPGNDTAR